MNVRHPTLIFIGRTWLALPALLCGGCGFFFDVPADLVDGNRDTSASSTRGRTSGEPNDGFGEAIIAVFDENGRARLQGVLDSSRDLDVFDLGGLAPGQRIIVDVDTSSVGGFLDSMIGLFDSGEDLFAQNDDRFRSLDALVDEVVRRGDDRYYLVVAGSPFAVRSEREGPYRIDIDVSTVDTPVPAAQHVYLNFDGASISADGIGTNSVPAFEAADIHPIYAGESELIKTVLIERIRAAYAGFDVTFSTSDDPAPSPPFSTVHFGGFHPPTLAAFGVAEGVDEFNASQDDIAVIFTETFTPTVFSITPTAEQMGVAIGNIAAHEIGHLLGLNHVEDVEALMDAVSPADAFLAEQRFKRAPLYEPEFFTIGFQDAPELLSDTVGGTAAKSSTSSRALTIPLPPVIGPGVSSGIAKCGELVRKGH